MPDNFFAVLFSAIILLAETSYAQLALYQSAAFQKAEKNISLSRVALQFSKDVPREKIEFSFRENLSWLEDYSNTFTIPGLNIVVADLKIPASAVAEVENHYALLKTLAGFEAFLPVLHSQGEEVIALNRVFVKVKTKNEEVKLEQLATELNFGLQEKYAYDNTVFIIHESNGFRALRLSCVLQETSFFEYAEPDLLFSPVVAANDPYYNRQWNIQNTGSPLQHNGTPGADMSVEDAWTITKGDTSIKIAILDSGVDTLHPDLIPNLLPGYDATGGGSRGYPNSNFEKDGHGTACAGIAAAKGENGIGITGVAPGCKIIPVKVFYYVDTALGLQFNPPIPYTTSLWIADAINWASQTAHADVMSNSWGIPDILFGLLQQPVALVEDAINAALENGRNGLGVPQLYSTGNEDGELIWPSRLPQTIAVTATSMCDERKSPASCDGEDWWGGNYGNGTDVGAPGVKISATDMLGNKGFSVGSYMADFNGTSAACPNAAAVMALILSVNPGLKAWDAKYLLASTADKVGGYAYDSVNYAGMWSQELGFGRVNAFAAVQAAMSYTGVKEQPAETDLSVYPNPAAASQFTVKFSLRESGRVKIFLSDISGKILSGTEQAFPDGLCQVVFDAPPSAGICFITVVANGEARHRKFIFLGR